MARQDDGSRIRSWEIRCILRSSSAGVTSPISRRRRVQLHLTNREAAGPQNASDEYCDNPKRSIGKKRRRAPCSHGRNQVATRDCGTSIS